jgi:PKD repeat protein
MEFMKFKSTEFISQLSFGMLLMCHIGLTQVHGQTIRCYTTEMEEQMYGAQKPTIDAQFEAWMARKRAEMAANPQPETGPRILPTVVHIIYRNENDAWNISNAQVLSQIQVLNEDFMRQNPDTGNTPVVFRPVASNSNIQFCLAQQDPAGNPTNGIIRHAFPNTTSYSTSTFNSQIKPNTIWDPNRYFNIWVANLSGGVLGYAQFPSGTGLPGLTGGNANTDGIVLLYSSVGRPPANPFPGQYNGGRTATHEAGHFLGLRHIWGDGGCTVDDYCDDTPRSSQSNSGCPNVNRCNDMTFPPNPTTDWPDMVQNYMDYTNDACMNIFTSNQTERMNVVLQNGTRRASLLTSNGCQPPILRPVASFTQTADSVCRGGFVAYRDNSQNNPDTRLWFFPGGVPASDTGATPGPVRYDSSGIYPVTLISTNVTGSDTLVRQLAVRVTDSLQISLDSLAPVCENAGVITLRIGFPRGGRYTGAGTMGDSLFHPSVAGVGTHTITYTLPGCQLSQSTSVQVLPVTAVHIDSLPARICLNAANLNLTASQPGGNFSGPGVTGNSFNPLLAGVGTHTVRYTRPNNNGCVSSDTATIVVDSLPRITTFPANIPAICVNSAPIALPQGVPSGSWSGTGVRNDSLIPSLAGAGVFAITYTTLPDAITGCVNRLIRSITINQPPTLSFWPVNPVCVRGSNILLNQANIPGGNYSGPGVSFGIFSPSQAGVGLHTIQYSGQSGGCAVTGSYTIRVFEAPPAEIEPVSGALRSVNSGSAYRWFVDGIWIDTIAIRTIVPQRSGVYQLIVDSAGCLSDTSAGFSFFMTTLNDHSPSSTQTIYPNPAQNALYLKGIDLTGQSNCFAVDAAGRRIRLFGQPEDDAVKLDVSVLPNGLYVLEFMSGNGLGRLRFVKR